VTVPAPTILELHPDILDDQIAALPASAGIYSLVPQSGTPHVSWSANLPRRLRRLLAPSSPGQGGTLQRLRAGVRRMECWPTGSKLESALLMYAIVRSHFQSDYMRRLRLRTPWFVTLAIEDEFPRLNVLNRIRRSAKPIFGPFASRDLAQNYQQEVEALFQIRRCTERLAPSPDHPGCIYGEMNQCLRPCQMAVTDDEYATEVQRVSEFLSSNGRSMLSALSGARDRACAEMDFEQAAQIHRRIDKLNSAAGARGEIVVDLEHLNGVALTRSISARQFRLWPLYRGYWQSPVDLDFSGPEPAAKSLDSELRERLTHALAQPLAEGERIEHLAILMRWYHSSWRDGQWFPFRNLTDLNYRKLVREVSNLVKADIPPKPVVPAC
jgi:excinuclease ABC subunit C